MRRNSKNMMAAIGPRPTPRDLRAASPLTEVHRPRARQAVDVVGAPAYDPNRTSRLINYLVDARQKCVRDRETDRFGSFQVNDHFKLGWITGPADRPLAVRGEYGSRRLRLADEGPQNRSY